MLAARVGKIPATHDMPKCNPKKAFLIVALLLVVALAGLLWWLGLSTLYAYLIGINTVTVLLYGYDKRQAIATAGRVPELVLHLAALAGGSPGALFAQGMFRHKTRKVSFKLVFAGIVLVQVAFVYSYWRFVLRAS
jgi:uncharacterized membrane protein YsdA (DUF1294 family)